MCIQQVEEGKIEHIDHIDDYDDDDDDNWDSTSLDYYPITYSTINFGVPIKWNLTSRIGKTTRINLNNHWDDFKKLFEADAIRYQKYHTITNNHNEHQSGNNAFIMNRRQQK